MRDAPDLNHDPVYVQQCLEPLAKGEGVACFLADGEGERSVLFFSHSLTGKAREHATDLRDIVRAAQAIAVQRRAREKAHEHGFNAVVA